MTKSKLKLRRFTEAENDFIREHYPHKKTKWVAEQLNRTENSINGKAFILKVQKTKEFIKNQLSAGAPFRFKKGKISWNKGKKMDDYVKPEVKEKILQTSFKPGQLPHNTKEDAFVSIRSDNRGVTYKWIRVSQGFWVPLHVKLWEDVNGKTPENHVIVFKNKNTLDCRIENLELISRSELMLRNSIQNYPQEIKETVRLLSKLNKIIDGKEQNSGPKGSSV